jgi:hypothetical protein
VSERESGWVEWSRGQGGPGFHMAIISQDVASVLLYMHMHMHMHRTNIHTTTLEDPPTPTTCDTRERYFLP